MNLFSNILNSVYNNLKNFFVWKDDFTKMDLLFKRLGMILYEIGI